MKKYDLGGDRTEFEWSSDDPLDSLSQAYAYVEDQGIKAIEWYWANKASKSRGSRAVRFAAILLTTVAGLIPIVMATGVRVPGLSDSTMSNMGYVLLALVGALLGLDKYAGFTTGWMRYIRTGLALQKTLEELRFDWLILRSKAANPPTPEEIQAMLARLSKFIGDVQEQVQSETELWITEFTNSLTQLDKDAKAQLESLKPATIDLTVTNGTQATSGFMVSVDGNSARQGQGNGILLKLLSPGHHRVEVTAEIGGKKVRAETSLELKPGETQSTSVTLV